MQRRSITTGLCAIALFATHASAQRYTLRKPSEQLDEVSMGFDVMTPCRMTLSNLGYFYGNYNRNNGVYDNGYVYSDNLTSKDGLTYYFEYSTIMQVCDKDGTSDIEGTYLKFTDCKAVPVDGTFSESKGGEITPGVFIDYTHYLTKWHKFGFTLGVSNFGANMTKTNEWTADIYARSDVYEATGVSKLDGFTGDESRHRVYSPDDPKAFIYYNKGIVSSTTNEYLGTATIDGGWRLNTAYVTLHLGPTYNFYITRHFIIRLSGGLAISEASIRYHWIEQYTAPLETGDVDMYNDGILYKQKILFGYWGNLGAHYRVSRIMTVFSAVQYQSLENLTAYANDGQKIFMNNSNMYSLRTGFTWSF